MAVQSYEASELDWLLRRAPANGLHTYVIDLEVENLMRRVRQGYIFNPPFTRGYAWTQEQASRFIDTLLRGEPTPPIFVYRNSNNKYLVVDGHHRIESLRRFYSGVFSKDKHGTVPFALSNLDDVMHKGLSYKQLPEDAKAVLDNYPLHYVIMEQDSEASAADAVYRIFARLNSGSDNLTADDLRAVVNSGEFGGL